MNDLDLVEIPPLRLSSGDLDFHSVSNVYVARSNSSPQMEQAMIKFQS